MTGYWKKKGYEMKILLSNDDGVHAQGIHELANELRVDVM